MNMQAQLQRALGVTILALLWAVLSGRGLAASPEDQVAGLERELLSLAKGVGPPAEKSPDAPP